MSVDKKLYVFWKMNVLLDIMRLKVVKYNWILWQHFFKNFIYLYYSTNVFFCCRISLICESFFPVWIFFENILNTILKEQFTISGLLVKNMLIEQYHLEKQFQFLKHLFLFQDDLIFPFYRRLFERVSKKAFLNLFVFFYSFYNDCLKVRKTADRCRFGWSFCCAIEFHLLEINSLLHQKLIKKRMML